MSAPPRDGTAGIGWLQERAVGGRQPPGSGRSGLALFALAVAEVVAAACSSPGRAPARTTRHSHPYYSHQA